MIYSEQVFAKALDMLKERRIKAELLLHEKRKAIYETISELYNIHKRMVNTSLLAIQKISQGCGKEVIEKLKADNLELEKKEKKLLLKNHIPEDYLKIQYYCKICKDTGYCDKGLCECFKKLLIKENTKDFAIKIPLERFSFKNFSFDYYNGTSLVSGTKEPITAREQAKKIFEFCQNYANNFPADKQSILICGGTGLGKTYISLIMAKEILEKGFSVIYISAIKLIICLEDERFKRYEQSKYSTDSFLECEFLIIDDFGCEMQNPFSLSSLYNIINTRLIENKPTIVITNLSIQGVSSKYGDWLVSRLFCGGYKKLRFYGKDIRQMEPNKDKSSYQNVP